MTVLGEALKQLRQEYASQGKISTFEALRAFLDPNKSIAPPSYDEVANRLQVTTDAFSSIQTILMSHFAALTPSSKLMFSVSPFSSGLLLRFSLHVSVL
jgi:hypothetical protein